MEKIVTLGWREDANDRQFKVYVKRRNIKG